MAHWVLSRGLFHSLEWVCYRWQITVVVFFVKEQSLLPPAPLRVHHRVCFSLRSVNSVKIHISELRSWSVSQCETQRRYNFPVWLRGGGNLSARGGGIIPKIICIKRGHEWDQDLRIAKIAFYSEKLRGGKAGSLHFRVSSSRIHWLNYIEVARYILQEKKKFGSIDHISDEIWIRHSSWSYQHSIQVSRKSCSCYNQKFG